MHRQQKIVFQFKILSLSVVPAHDDEPFDAKLNKRLKSYLFQRVRFKRKKKSMPTLNLYRLAE